jgi:stress response protein SCP2
MVRLTQENEVMTSPHKENNSVNLTQASQGLKRLNITVTWSFKPYGGKPMDVDFACLALDRHAQTREDTDFVFYSNPQGAGLAIKLLEGAEDGAEGSSPASLATSTIFVDLDNLSFDVWRIMFVLSVYQGVENDQTFDVLKEAVLRIENADTGQELARSIFTNEGMDEATAIKLGEITRDGVEWSFTKIAEAVKDGLADVAQGYGILISSTT